MKAKFSSARSRKRLRSKAAWQVRMVLKEFRSRQTDGRLRGAN